MTHYDYLLPACQPACPAPDRAKCCTAPGLRYTGGLLAYNNIRRQLYSYRPKQVPPLAGHHHKQNPTGDSAETRGSESPHNIFSGGFCCRVRMDLFVLPMCHIGRCYSCTYNISYER